MGTAEAVAAVVRLGTRPGTSFVGVDGPGGAGKSTLAARLVEAAPGAVLVAVDDFSGPGVAEWDWDRMHEQVVAPLLAGRVARYEVRRWDGTEVGLWRTVQPGRLVVVEGVSSTRDEADVPWALRIWVHTPEQVRLARVLGRDGEAMRSRWLEEWIPSEQAYIAAQRPDQRADLVVSGDT